MGAKSVGGGGEARPLEAARKRDACHTVMPQHA